MTNEPIPVPTRVTVEAKQALAGISDRVGLAAARRLASGDPVSREFLSLLEGFAPGPITSRWMSILNSQPQVKSKGKDAVDYSDGIMIALMLPPSLAEMIALPDAQPADEMHITLAYLGVIEDVDDDSDYLLRLLGAVRSAAERQKTLSGSLSGIGRFTGEDKDAFYLSADVPGLEDFRHDLVAALTDAQIDVDREHGFTPHVTLAYINRDVELPIRRAQPRSVEFNEVSIVYGTNVIPVPFGGNKTVDGDERLSLSDPLPTTTSPTVNDEGKSYDPSVRVSRRAETRRSRNSGKELS